MPYGWLLANGASVLRSQYNKLFALIGTKFGAVDEAHFNLPNLHHRFIEGTTSLSEVGSYVEAGLPNIHGEWSNTYAVIANSEADGACYFKYPHMTASYLLESSGGSGQMGFDASRICSLYQTGMNEVRVNAIFGFNLIRAF